MTFRTLLADFDPRGTRRAIGGIPRWRWLYWWLTRHWRSGR